MLNKIKGVILGPGLTFGAMVFIPLFFIAFNVSCGKVIGSLIINCSNRNSAVVRRTKLINLNLYELNHILMFSRRNVQLKKLQKFQPM